MSNLLMFKCNKLLRTISIIFKFMFGTIMSLCFLILRCILAWWQVCNRFLLLEFQAENLRKSRLMKWMTFKNQNRCFIFSHKATCSHFCLFGLNSDIHLFYGQYSKYNKVYLNKQIKFLLFNLQWLGDLVHCWELIV